jgi:hypothetical protein
MISLKDSIFSLAIGVVPETTKAQKRNKIIFNFI